MARKTRKIDPKSPLANPKSALQYVEALSDSSQVAFEIDNLYQRDPEAATRFAAALAGSVMQRLMRLEETVATLGLKSILAGAMGQQGTPPSRPNPKAGIGSGGNYN